MIGCLRTRVHKQPIIALYFEFETVLKFYNLKAQFHIIWAGLKTRVCNLKVIITFLFLNQITCCGYSKEPAQ